MIAYVLMLLNHSNCVPLLKLYAALFDGFDLPTHLAGKILDWKIVRTSIFPSIDSTCSLKPEIFQYNSVDISPEKFLRYSILISGWWGGSRQIDSPFLFAKIRIFRGP